MERARALRPRAPLHDYGGLGLFIARRLAEANGGTLRVESPGAGEGTTLVVELPLEGAGEVLSSADDP